MKHGFIRIAAATPDVRVADCTYNGEQILAAMREATARGCELLILPELCVTGYTCGDLFRQNVLMAEAHATLAWLVQESRSLNLLTFIGMPLSAAGRLFNCAVVLCRGEILGVVPKTWLPNHAEFSEKRAFTSPWEHNAGDTIVINGQTVPFGTRLLFAHTQKTDFVVAAEICEDIWSPVPPSCAHALAGATVLVNLSASDESAGKAAYRRTMVNQQSARLLCAYAYVSAGEGESTTDLVFSGHNIIAENGELMAESVLFENGMIQADIDLALLTGERARATTFVNGGANAALITGSYRVIPFTIDDTACVLERRIERTPFVPTEEAACAVRCEEVLTMQAVGLAQRLRHTGVTRVTLGLSGGQDSTLALLVALRAFDRLGLPREGIYGLSLPCFGTSAHARDNARRLAEGAGITFREIVLDESVLRHFQDIEHAPDVYDLVYENAQARERTQVLMDVAAQIGGFMLGTGDLSELALGFTTYGGDHMSMYGVNASVPKTLIAPILRTVAETTPVLRDVLHEVAAKPISPELLPTDGGAVQETERIVGPYILHDFFIYQTLRRGAPPEKVLYLAEKAFVGEYDRETLERWLAVFYRRFFMQQYKRSCMPDGPKVGSVCLSPRGDWRMPSDASVAAWLR